MMAGNEEFTEYLQLQGLQEEVVKALLIKGCDNENVLAALSPGDIQSLGAPSLQQSLLLTLGKAAAEKVQLTSPLELTNRAEFEPYLRSQGLSQHTLDCLKKEGCDNLMVLKNISDNDIDKCEEIKPFQRSLLKAIMPKVRPKSKPRVEVKIDEQDPKHVHIMKTKVIADNIQQGSEVEGVVHHTMSGKTLNIDTIYIDAKNVAPGSTVTGVRVVSSQASARTTDGAAMPASSGFVPFQYKNGAFTPSTTTTPQASQNAPQPAPRTAPQPAPQSNCPFAPPPPTYLSYKDMPDVAKMVVQSRPIKVAPATVDLYRRIAKNPAVYNMSLSVRGRCLLFNSQEERPGSSVDAEKLAHVFSQLHFNIRKEKTPRIVDVRKHLVRYREYCLRLDVKPQCLVMGFLSKCSPEGIVASNGEVLPYQDIYGQFQGEAEAGLEGIPKIFIFHGPRTNTREERLLLMTEDSSRPRPGQDMMAIFPTNEAYNSWTDPTKGTWFVEGFTRIFEEFACTDDLDTLLTKVNDLVSRKVSADGQGMMVDPDNKLSKKLFFFPSIAVV